MFFRSPKNFPKGFQLLHVFSQVIESLGGGFKYFLFSSSLPGEMIRFD